MPKIIKLGFIAALLLLTLLFGLLWPAYDQRTCAVDEGHEVTYGLNRQISLHAWKAVIGAGQVLMDAWVMIATIFW